MSVGLMIDNKSLENYYKKYFDLLIFVTTDHGISQEIGQEIVQEVFIKLSQYQKEVPSSSMKSFLIKVTRNSSLDYLRKAEHKKRSADTDLGKFSTADSFTSERAQSIEQGARIIDELASKKGADIFKMHYQDDLTISEIAEKTGQSQTCLRVRLHRFIKKHRERIQARHNEADEREIK